MFNTTERPVAITADGATLDGLTAADIDPDDPVAAALLTVGDLIDVTAAVTEADTQPTPRQPRTTTKEG